MQPAKMPPFRRALVLLLLVAHAAQARSSNDDTRNKVAVKQVWAVEGDDIDLPCDIKPTEGDDDVISMVLWFKDEASIPLYNLDARKGNLFEADHWTMSGSLGNRTYFQVDADGAAARLKVKAVTYEDQGLFRCRVDFANSPTRNTRVNLTLIVPSSKPIIYDAQGREVTGAAGPFLEGYDLLLTCQVSGGKPRPTVTWWKGDEMMDGVMEETMEIGTTAASKFTVNRLFIPKVTRSLWGTRIECRSESRAQEKSKVVVKRVPLDIYLKPVAVVISQSEEQIYAGRPVTVRCETWGSAPPARIVWRLSGKDLQEASLTAGQRGNSTASKHALVLEEGDDGKELTCRAENPRFPGGVLERTKVLRVLYAPTASAQLAAGYDMATLREGDDVKLVCNYRCNPEPTGIEWIHDDVRLEHDVSKGVLVASSTLTLRELSLTHTGAYSCLVRNAVGEFRSALVDIRMKYVPRCKEGQETRDVIAAAGEILRLQCQIEADPRDNVRFSWTRNSSLGDVSAVPNPRPSSSSLEYLPLADEDFGTLACWASNSIGRQKSPCIFNLLPAKPPQRPVDCNIRNETSAMEVNCIPGSSGGLPQHFLLEVRGVPETTGGLQIPQSDQGVGGSPYPEASTSGTVYQDRQDEPSFTLYNLEPGYYTLAVYAENSQGRSSPVLIENIRVSEQPQSVRKPAESKFLGELAHVIPHANSLESAFIVLGLIIAVSLILVGIGVAIGLVICRRRGRSQPHVRESESLDDFMTPTYVAAQRVEPRIRYGSGTDRRRSQRTSLYMEDTRNDPDLLQQVDIDLLNS